MELQPLVSSIWDQEPCVNWNPTIVRTIGQDAFREGLAACPKIVDGIVQITCSNADYPGGCLNMCGKGGPSFQKEKCHVEFNFTEFRFLDGCYGLTSVSFSSTVRKINAYALSSCYNLESIDVPDTVLEIGDHAFPYDFSGCFKFNASVPRIIGLNALPQNPGNCITRQPSLQPSQPTSQLTRQPSLQPSSEPSSELSTVMARIVKLEQQYLKLSKENARLLERVSILEKKAAPSKPLTKGTQSPTRKPTTTRTHSPSRKPTTTRTHSPSRMPTTN